MPPPPPGPAVAQAENLGGALLSLFVCPKCQQASWLLAEEPLTLLLLPAPLRSLGSSHHRPGASPGPRGHLPEVSPPPLSGPNTLSTQQLERFLKTSESIHATPPSLKCSLMSHHTENQIRTDYGDFPRPPTPCWPAPDIPSSRVPSHPCPSPAIPQSLSMFTPTSGSSWSLSCLPGRPSPNFP